MERLKKTLRTEHRLKASELLLMLQQAAAEDANRRGGGQQVLLSHDCTWVLVKNRVEISRWPEPGEELTLTTWPIKGRFGLYPRMIELYDAAGERIVRTESIWAIMDIHSRSMLPGEERGIELEGVEEGRVRPQRRIAMPEGGRTGTITPSPAQIDENGHMNNAAYLDAVEPLLPETLRGRVLSAITVDYEHEILAGHSAQLRAVAEENSCFFEGSADGKVCFRLREDFAV